MLDALGIQLSANETDCCNSTVDRNQYFSYHNSVIYCVLAATSLSHDRDIWAEMKISILSFLVKKTSKKCYVLRCSVSEIQVTVKLVISFLAVVLFMVILRMLIHGAQQASVVVEWSWNTHKKYCDMLLTLGICNSQAGTASRKMCYINLVDVIQTIMCFHDWSSISVRQEM